MIGNAQALRGIRDAAKAFVDASDALLSLIGETSKAEAALANLTEMAEELPPSVTRCRKVKVKAAKKQNCGN